LKLIEADIGLCLLGTHTVTLQTGKGSLKLANVDAELSYIFSDKTVTY